MESIMKMMKSNLIVAVAIIALVRTADAFSNTMPMATVRRQATKTSIHPGIAYYFASPVVMHSTAAKTDAARPEKLDEKQLDFTMGYLNKHHGNVLRAFAETFSELGQEQIKRNAWSGGSYQIEAATIIGLDSDQIELDVMVQERGKDKKTERVKFDLDTAPVTTKRNVNANMPPIPRDLNLHPVDDMIRRLNRLCWIVDQPGVTGKLIQLGIQIGGEGVGEIKENLYLNQVPHNRYVRTYFYDMARDAALEAVTLCSQGKISNRMKIVSLFPEMNPDMDSYRVATILEMVRTIVIRLVEQNLRVRVCVQQSMGVGIFTGIPKQLSGVSRLVQMMDWQAEEGEENEGMIGNFLNFGAIGEEHVVNAHVNANGTKVEQDDVFIIIAPQSMVGIETSIYGPLSKMVQAAGDRPVILVNPDLADKISSEGQQSVRGRQERIDFADSFKTIWHFQNLYVSGTSYFPILGSMTKSSPLAAWVAHQRRDLANNDGEVYIPVLAGEEMPKGDVILENFGR